MSENLISVLTSGGPVKKARLPDLSDEEFKVLYREMVRIRVFDRRMLELQLQGRIGFYGPARGQEATVVGSIRAARAEDWLVPALREGFMALMRGLPMQKAVAQLVGNDLDPCRGRQMPCHYSWKKGRFVSMSSVVGTQISQAAGIAMAARYRGSGEAVLGFLGDGATSGSDFHSGLNFAGVWKAPVVFVCQNNQWSISVPFEKQTSAESIAAKAAAYGMPGRRVDGNDVLAVLQVVRGALDRARAGEGPTLIEAVTFRQLGHSSSDDPTRYRDPDEVRKWKEKDPIDRYRAFLESRSLWSSREEEELLDAIRGEVNQAIREAEAGPPVDRDSMITDVLASMDPRTAEHFEDVMRGRDSGREDPHHEL